MFKLHVMRYLSGVIIAFISVTLLSCSGSGSGNVAQQSGAVSDNGAGEKLYTTNCAVCHQGNGSGVPSAFPPLANNAMVVGDKNALVKVMLEGRTGEIVVNGLKYNGVMTAYSNLTDSETAQLLTYIRTSFGNAGTSISAEEVKGMRVMQ